MDILSKLINHLLNLKRDQITCNFRRQRNHTYELWLKLHSPWVFFHSFRGNWRSDSNPKCFERQASIPLPPLQRPIIPCDSIQFVWAPMLLHFRIWLKLKHPGNRATASLQPNIDNPEATTDGVHILFVPFNNFHYEFDHWEYNF